jgi:hypothetical protein
MVNRGLPSPTKPEPFHRGEEEEDPSRSRRHPLESLLPYASRERLVKSVAGIDPALLTCLVKKWPLFTLPPPQTAGPLRHDIT